MMCCSMLQCVAVHYSVLQCVAVRCSALQVLQLTKELESYVVADDKKATASVVSEFVGRT